MIDLTVVTWYSGIRGVRGWQRVDNSEGITEKGVDKVTDKRQMKYYQFRNALWSVSHDLEDSGDQRLANVLMSLGYVLADIEDGLDGELITDRVRYATNEFYKNL